MCEKEDDDVCYSDDILCLTDDQCSPISVFCSSGAGVSLLCLGLGAVYRSEIIRFWTLY